jgi:hypothetical protein
MRVVSLVVKVLGFIKQVFGGYQVHIVWAVLSSILLITAYFIDPYVFGFGIIFCFWVTLTVVLLSLVINWRNFAWCVLSMVPVLIAFYVIQSFNWA